jgi:hypothetical protein
LRSSKRPTLNAQHPMSKSEFVAIVGNSGLVEGLRT